MTIHRQIEKYRAEFSDPSKPFPYVVIDDMWSDVNLRHIADAFPAPESGLWKTYPDPKEYGKRCLDQFGAMPSNAKRFIGDLNSDYMINTLRDITGITDLQQMDITGGGLHLSTTGARLAMHRDFNLLNGLARRLNLLVFLTDRPDNEFGGSLWLGGLPSKWPDKSAPVGEEIKPRRNRTVIFECGPKSWHGHPIPIETDWQRKSIAAYYYSPIPAGWPAPHSTVWADDQH